MADNQVLAEVAGLQTSNNTFSATPPGSQFIAENVMIIQKGVGVPRNGQERAYVAPLGGNPTEKLAMQLVEFSGSLLASWAEDKLSTTYELAEAGNPSTAYAGGPYNPVDCDGVSTSYGRMKFGFAAQFLHFCTQAGAKVLESPSAKPRNAGLLRMPDVRAAMLPNSTFSGGDSNWLPYGSSVAYRAVLRRPTSTGVSLLSAPSGRTVVTNRIVAVKDGMTRSGGTTVTVTVAGGVNPGLAIGDTFTLTPGEANFPAGQYTVASAGAGDFTYANAGSNVSNTLSQDFDTGPRPVAVVIELPEDATTSTPARLYRSRSTTTTVPSDELFLVNELTPSGSDITNGYIEYDDATPESVINEPLYTNPQTGEGATQANFAPPLYRDLAWWNSAMWYLNTTGLQQLTIQMLGVGSPDGVQNNDTFTIAVPGATPLTVRFRDSPSVTEDVQIVSDGTPAFNIERTAQNFIVTLNDQLEFLNADVRVYYSSAQGEPPGRMLLQAIAPDLGPFGVTVSRPLTWTPAMDTLVPVESMAERRPNGLDHSKPGQPEAVPVTNRTAVGSASYDGARALALQNALLVFKQGDGIWAVTGQAPYQVQQISTANLLAIDAAAVFADSAWAYTDQGILRISDAGGAVVVSRPIETELNALRYALPEETQDWSFAVPYEVERRIMFYVPADVDEDGRPQLQAYCYNNATDTWTKYTYEAFSGVVSPTLQRLYLGTYDAEGSTSRITLERKGDGHLDVADESFSVNVIASQLDARGNRVVRLSSNSNARAGNGLLQGDFRTKLRVARPDLGSRWWQLWEDMPFAVAGATIFRCYTVKTLFQPVGAPSARKTLTRLSFLFKPEGYEALAGTALVLTDQVQAEVLFSAPFAGFGLTKFGGAPFGDPSPLVVDVNPLSAKWTNAAQFFVGFELSEVWTKFQFQGFTAMVSTQDGPIARGK